MPFLILFDKHCSYASKDHKWEWEHKPRLRNTFGFVIVEDVITLTNLCFEETAIPLCIHLVAKFAEESSEHAFTISRRILVGALSHAFISEHEESSLA